MRTVRDGLRLLRRGPGIDHGIWSPFRSLLAAQLLAAILGFGFWVLVARLVDAREIGVAAAAISAQTLLGMVTVLGFSTFLIAELPLHDPLRQRRLVLRSLLVVLVASVVAGGVMVAVHPVLPANLNQALGNPLGAAAFVLGVTGFAWGAVIDDACLALKRSGIQVGRNLFASGIRFPVTAVLLLLGFTDAAVLQVCWVLPLLASIPFTLRLLRLPRGDRSSPALVTDVSRLMGPALRNHALSLSLAAGSQMVPVVAGLTLASVDNAEFTIAWLIATFVFLPPYLLSTALFAHGANVSTEEFRSSMARTVPAAVLLSAALCVGSWVLGEPVLRIFGGAYADESWTILALLVPAGLWMVFKDHLVALWRSQRRFSVATRLTTGALVLEIAGAVTGAVLGGAVGLCLGWLAAMGLEIVLGTPWLRQAFGGLRWQLPLPSRARGESGRVASHLVAVVALVVAVTGVGVWTAVRPDPGGPDDGGGPTSADTTAETCAPTADRPGPHLDLNVQSATGTPRDPIRSEDEVRRLVAVAQEAGARVISTSTSFRTMQATPTSPIGFDYVDRTIAAARAAGLQVRLQLVGMPDWALDTPMFDRQPPRSDAELDHWARFVTAVMEHVGDRVDFVEVWTEPNQAKWWPTGPDPVEFTRLLSVTYAAVRSVSPSAQVVSGGLIGNDIGFLTEVYAATRTLELTDPPFDLVGVHPFTGSAAPDSIDPARRYDREPFGEYDENFAGLTALHEVTAEHGQESTPLYVTQFGYSTRDAKEVGAVPDDVRAGYLTTALGMVTCLPAVSVFSWYTLHPTPWDPAPWALLDEAGRPNLTYAALRDWAERVAQAREEGGR